MSLSRVPIKAAMTVADHYYRRFDEHRDADERRQQINMMAAAGTPIADIADHLGLSPSHVRRINNGRFQVAEPIAIPRPDYSDEHCWQLEHTADTAIDLACRLREDDPRIIWDTLTHLTRTELQELAVILLAAIPIDSTKTELFGWVIDLAPTTEVA